MKRFLLFLIIIIPVFGYTQNTPLTPTISPGLFQHNSTITVTYDVTGTSLASLTDAWAWVWIPDGAAINAKYNINPATAAADAAKFTKNVADGVTTFSLTFKPMDFFVQDISTRTSMGILLKAADWSGGQTTDYVANFGFFMNLLQPAARPVFVDNGEQIAIQAQTPVVSTFELFINEVSVNTQAGITNYTYNHTVTETSGSATVRLTATSPSGSAESSFQYLISTISPVMVRPSGIIPGINYHDDDNKVTLCLWAPEKESVYVRGDFPGSDWDVHTENLMKRDGEYFWIELDGLTPEEEYAYQYLVDETIWIGDPYADKILDPEDQYIPESTYPDLKDYPSKALGNYWYTNRLGVFQTNQQPYQWQVPNFQKPDKEKLVIYELLVRDFFASSDRSYQNLIDTLGYFKKLGINTIQLMPITEFNGNESWGYNPAFMFAPDKAYGTKNDLKQFIDACHQNGLAVILDIVMNQQDAPNPYAMLDFDFSPGVFRPTANNKWFNANNRHPYAVFFDLNHESSYTKAYLDTVNHYWLNEYKFDGFRFDLSKGFTQNDKCGGSTSNENCFQLYDATRISILKRMADVIWSHTEDAIVILEHFAENSEEKELAEYRLEEGKGMLLWTNVTHAYAQNSMGYETNSDFSWINTDLRNWEAYHAVGYMESHDEERMVYRNLQNGRNVSGYNIKTLPIALKRVQAAATMFYTIPGPKMLWQFGELGYDYPINYCADGSINNECRTNSKPVKWEYLEEPNRYALFMHISDLLRLRNTYDVFTDGTPTISGGTSLKKQMILRNSPYTDTPANAGEMNVVIAVNFDVSTQNFAVEFPHPGTWYEYYSNGTELTVAAATAAVQLDAGEYKIFTDVQIDNPSVITSNEQEIFLHVSLYPNPTGNVLRIDSDEIIQQVRLSTMHGSVFILERISLDSWDVSGLAAGVYIADIRTSRGSVKIKVIKQNN